ncbi:hypothetical protein GCM10009599_18660 [Luteococcus peritonei]
MAAACLVALALAVLSLLGIRQAGTAHGQTDLVGWLWLARLTNSGTAWASLLVLTGFLVRSPRAAMLAAPVTMYLSLCSHYALGIWLGPYDGTIWGQNLSWFGLALVLGIPLGWVGAMARRGHRAARLVVPAGAVAEPLLLGMLFPPAHLGPADALGTALAGGTLLLLGLLGGSRVLVREPRAVTPDAFGAPRSPS